MCPRERFSLYKSLSRLVLCYKRIGPPACCILFTFVTCCSLQIILSQNYLLPLISVLAENTLLKTAYHFLLLLVGFDTLTYRKDYDRSPTLVGHQDSFLASLSGSEAVGERSRNSKFSYVSPRSIYGETSNEGKESASTYPCRSLSGSVQENGVEGVVLVVIQITGDPSAERTAPPRSTHVQPGDVSHALIQQGERGRGCGRLRPAAAQRHGGGGGAWQSCRASPSTAREEEHLGEGGLRQGQG